MLGTHILPELHEKALSADKHMERKKGLHRIQLALDEEAFRRAATCPDPQMSDEAEPRKVGKDAGVRGDRV